MVVVILPTSTWQRGVPIIGEFMSTIGGETTCYHDLPQELAVRYVTFRVWCTCVLHFVNKSATKA